MKTIYAILLGILFSINLIHAQYTIDWSYNFGGPTNDYNGWSIRQANAGYITSVTKMDDAWLVHLNENGTFNWESSVGGSMTDRFSIVLPLIDGYIATGTTRSSDGDIPNNYGDEDIFVARFDLNGNVLWVKNYGGSEKEFRPIIIPTSDGNFMIATGTTSNDYDILSNKGLSDFWIFKIDPQGDIIWSKTFGGSGYDIADNIIETSDGDFVIVGFSGSFDGDVTPTGPEQLWLIKIDTNGNLVWEENVGSSLYTIANGLIELNDGNLFITGRVLSTAPSQNDLYLSKISATGQTIWDHMYGGTSEDVGFACIETSQGICITGSSTSQDGDISNPNGMNDAWIIFIDDLGNITWSKNFGGTKNEYFSAVCPSIDGNGLIFSGFSYSNDGDLPANNGFSDLWVMKLDWTTTSISVDLGQDILLCPGDSALLDAYLSICSNCTYQWNDGNTSPSRMVSPVQSTTYTVVVTDANGNTGTDEILVSVSDLSANLSSTNSSGCLPNGTASALGQDGCSNYSYLWNTGDSNSNISGLSAGTYTVTINDGCCELIETISVGGAPGSVIVNLGPDTTFCESNPYQLNAYNPSCINCTYQWNDGNTDSIRIVSPIISTTYSVVVTDASGCSGTDEITLDIGSSINSTIDQIINNQCAGDELASIDISANGVMPLSYAWSNGSNNEDISGLASGTYTLTITDGNACTRMIDAMITSPPPFDYTIDGTNTCGNGFSSAYVEVNGATPPYTYLWSNGATTDEINNINDGLYTVTVTDANGCTFEDAVAVTSFDEVIFDGSISYITCHNAIDGAIDINVTQGTAPYTYNWSTGASTAFIDNLSAGTYTLFVTDANNCITIKSFELINPNPISLTFTTIPPSPGGNDGSITIQPAGGTPPYNVVWSDGQTGLTASGLSAGTYTATITDANGCTYSEELDPTTTSSSQLTDLNSFELFPNPSNGALQIQAEWGQVNEIRISIIDLIGRELRRFDLKDSTIRLNLDLADWSAGVYFIRLQTIQGEKTLKWVKQ